MKTLNECAQIALANSPNRKMGFAYDYDDQYVFALTNLQGQPVLEPMIAVHKETGLMRAFIPPYEDREKINRYMNKEQRIYPKEVSG